jgi:hypothetical protein
MLLDPISKPQIILSRDKTVQIPNYKSQINSRPAGDHPKGGKYQNPKYFGH